MYAVHVNCYQPISRSGRKPSLHTHPSHCYRDPCHRRAVTLPSVAPKVVDALIPDSSTVARVVELLQSSRRLSTPFVAITGAGISTGAMARLLRCYSCCGVHSVRTGRRKDDGGGLANSTTLLSGFRRGPSVGGLVSPLTCGDPWVPAPRHCRLIATLHVCSRVL